MLERAVDMGLDLVEVSPNSNPPVCRILDYGKYKYELAKKDKLSKKKQHTMQMKEMRYRPKIDEHDFQFKTKHVREFISDGSKVKAFVMFRGREMAHTEFGRKVLERLAEELKDIANILGVSLNTITSHRYKIRTKLGLKNKGTNLRSYLLSLEE